MPIDLIVQMISGAVGGNIAGAAIKNFNMGWLLNSVAGLAGGGLAGHFLGPVVGPLLGVVGSAAAAGSLDPMAIASSVVTGGLGGTVVSALAGVVKNMLVKA